MGGIDMTVAIVGLGKYYEEIIRNLNEGVKVTCCADNGDAYVGKIVCGVKVCKTYQINIHVADYFIIACNDFTSVAEQLQQLGVSKNKIVQYFSEEIDFYDYVDIFKVEKTIIHSLNRRISILNKQINTMKQDNEYILDHYAYEIADKIRRNELKLPNIAGLDETIDKIINDRVSISRYGDGEFQIILGKAKDKYQKNDEKLAERLKEILFSDLKGHIVAIADDYGSLDIYGVKTRTDIRKYMTTEKRRNQYKYIDFNKYYYNAYITRPYIYYSSEKREEAKVRFDRIRQIWHRKDVVIVEGEKTRMGVGNDLLSNTNSLVRILAPSEDAFDKYDEILKFIISNIDTHKQILIALGPTATVLAYDLAKLGYWALDIGHIDIEYEWYLRNNGKCRISGKYTNEVLGGDNVDDVFDNKYDKSILVRIGSI